MSNKALEVIIDLTPLHLIVDRIEDAGNEGIGNQIVCASVYNRISFAILPSDVRKKNNLVKSLRDGSR